MLWGRILPALFLGYVLCAGTVQALDRMPPLPFDCVAADESKDLENKVKLYTRCLGGSPVNIDTGMKLEDWQRPEIHFKRGNALFELRRYSEALADYDLLISKSGGHVWAYHQRGLTHLAVGMEQKALADFNEALKRNSDAIDVRHDRGQLHAKLGSYQLALEDLRRAASLSPKTALFANDLAWLLATCPDTRFRNGREAVKYARKALVIEKNASYLDTLAAALARAGDFKQAVIIQKEALELLRNEVANQQSVLEFSSRLELYSSGQAYTERKRQ